MNGQRRFCYVSPLMEILSKIDTRQQRGHDALGQYTLWRLCWAMELLGAHGVEFSKTIHQATEAFI